MKTWARLTTPLILWSCAVAAWAAPARASQPSTAIQAIEQAPEPSAVVAAYANGFATDSHDPNLYAAYVRRMTDLSLPELAYHQAQTLTTLDPTNGLAWGVLAYVDARRGAMSDAIFAIKLAGPFAPQDPFVQRTAGEILAWYDLKADRAQLPENVQQGLAKLRTVMRERPAFIAAYETAQRAYQAQSAAGTLAPILPPTQMAPEAQGQSQEIPPSTYGYAAEPPPDYYPDSYPYSYDAGADWVEPAPWWWWQPTGAFDGLGFYPYSGAVLFDRNDFFHRHPFDRHHEHGQHSLSEHRNPALWHREGHNGVEFYGAPARPSPSLQRSVLTQARTGTTSHSWAFLSRGTSLPGGANAASEPRLGPVTSRPPMTHEFTIPATSWAELFGHQESHGVNGLASTRPGAPIVPRPEAVRPETSVPSSPLARTTPLPSWSHLFSSTPTVGGPASGNAASIPSHETPSVAAPPAVSHSGAITTAPAPSWNQLFGGASRGMRR